MRVLAYRDQPFNYSWVNNWGAGQISGELLCFLNDDTTVIYARLARATGRTALAAGRRGRRADAVLYPDDTIQHAGVILGLGGVAGHACHGLPRGARGYFGRACLEQDVSCLTAACMVMRRSVFRELGGFDETLAVAFNDVDLCVRASGSRLAHHLDTQQSNFTTMNQRSVGRHDSRERANQFAKAVALMRKRWGPVLDCDPCL